MKTIKFLSLALFAATMLAGCNKADNSTPEPSNTAVKFTTAITKASGTSWAENDKIGVFMMNTGVPLTTARLADNWLYTRVGETFTTDNPIYYPQAGNVDFVAYYPRRTTPGTNPYIYKVVLGDQEHPETFDLLWSNAANVSKGTTAVALEFAHKLSRIAINIKAGAGLTPADLSGMSMTINGMATNADFDLATGILSDQSNAALIAPTGATPATGFDKAFTAIAVPQTTNGTTTMSFTVGSDHYTYTMPATEFGSGMSYPYTITISKTEIKVTAGDITDWTSGGAAVPGTAYSYQVGDYFPNPNVDMNNATEKANILGVVFRAKTGAKLGLVVSLNEANMKWGASGDTYAKDLNNGATNMTTIKELDASLTNYPAFKWCDDYGAGTPFAGQWYLPAQKELADLLNTFTLDKDGFITKLTAAGGTGIGFYYWSSSESTPGHALIVDFGFGGSTVVDKFVKKNVRAVLAF